MGHDDKVYMDGWEESTKSHSPHHNELVKGDSPKSGAGHIPQARL